MDPMNAIELERLDKENTESPFSSFTSTSVIALLLKRCFHEVTHKIANVDLLGVDHRDSIDGIRFQPKAGRKIEGLIIKACPD